MVYPLIEDNPVIISVDRTSWAINLLMISIIWDKGRVCWVITRVKISNAMKQQH